MPFAAGVYSITSNSFAPSPVTGTTISSTAAQSTWSDLSTGLSTCLLKDGTQTATASVPFAAGISVVSPMITTSTTFALVNTTATTVNFAGAATALNMGAATGTITFAGSTVPQNSQSTAYTTVAADAGKNILHPTADNNARTFTIDSNANVPYPVGTCLTFVNQINTVTIAITSDTLTWAGAGSSGSRTLAAGGMATAMKITSTIWFISGSGLS